MFGVGFSELVVIMLVALIVIGPERLPKVARTLGHIVGRMQRYINSIKAEVSAEEYQQWQQRINQGVLRAEQEANKIAQALNQQTQQVSSAVAQPAPAAPHQTSAGPQPAAEQKSMPKNE